MDAFERKVRPIYDALDSRNWKGAAKLANSALGKYKNNPLLKTLKAVALDRAGKSQEAFQICEEVRATVPTNDQILHTLCIVYRSTGNLDCLTKAYAAACEKAPKNQDLLHGLFGCYVREGLHSSQQQVATKIYRQIGTEKYLWWVVVSLLLQAWSEPAGIRAPMGVTQTLKLAESMIERHFRGKGKLESKEALLVYIDVLHAQGKTESALQHLEGSLGDLCPLTREKLQLQAQCHVQLKNWANAADLFKEILSTHPDDFHSLQSYLDCVLPSTAILLRNSGGWMELHYEACQLTRRLPCGPQSLEGTPDEDNVKEAESTVALIVSAMEEEVESTKSQLPILSSLRCAKLAELELVSRKVKLGHSDENDLVNAILAVFRAIGCLNSCAADVKLYSSSLTQDSKHLLAREVAKIDTSQSKELDGLKCQLSAHQIIADLDFSTCSSGDELVQLSETCCKLFMDSLPYIQDLDPREAGPVDDAIEVATTALMSAHCDDQEGDLHIWQALGILASALDKRPFNARLNLDICALYGLLGAPHLALQHLERLEVKYIQMDSLASHFILPFLLGYHRTAGGRRLLVETILLFEEHDKDAGETIYTAYQRGTLTKIFEFLHFKETLELSYTLYFALAEEGILRLTESIGVTHGTLVQTIKEVCSALPVNMVDDSHLDRIRFNQDLASRSKWFSPSLRHPKISTREWWTGWGAGVKSKWPDMHAYQKCMKRHIRGRWLLPHILYGIWSGDSLQAAQEALSTLLTDAGVDPDMSIANITEAMVSLNNASVDLLSKIETFRHMTLSLGLQMALAVYEGSGREVGPVDVYIEMWKSLVELLCMEMGRMMSCAKGIDVCVGSLLSEEISWMTYSVQALSKAIGGKSENVGEHLLVSQAISEVVDGIYKPLKQIVNQISVLVQRTAIARAKVVVAGLENKQLPKNKFLHNFTIQSNAHDYFADVISEQQESWKLFCTMGEKLLSILEKLQ